METEISKLRINKTQAQASKKTKITIKSIHKCGNTCFQKDNDLLFYRTILLIRKNKKKAKEKSGNK